MSGKFHCFNAIDRSIEMLKNSWISKNFYWNEKCLNILRIPNSDLPEGNYSAFHQIKVSYVSGTNIFKWRFTGIYRHLLFMCSENAVLEPLEMVERKCFSDTNLKHVFGCVVGVYFLLCWESWDSENEWGFLSKTVLYWVMFFASFCWLRDFLPENLKLEDKLQI